MKFAKTVHTIAEKTHSRKQEDLVSAIVDRVKRKAMKEGAKGRMSMELKKWPWARKTIFGISSADLNTSSLIIRKLGGEGFLIDYYAENVDGKYAYTSGKKFLQPKGYGCITISW